jgi:hypothetical protein
MNTAHSIAGITPEEIKRLTARFAVKPGPTATEKAGEGVTESAVFTKYVDVTPDMAARWLKVNFRNRPVSDDTVRAYALDMINGTWTATHQGIAFNDRDELIDGQHRLLAVVKAGKTVRMMVTFGLPAKIEGGDMTTMDAIDRGRTRSVSDQLKIQHGLKDGALIASVSASLSNICCLDRNRRPSVDQTLKVYRAFEPSVNFVVENRCRKHGLKAAGVLAGFAFAHAALGKVVEEMFKQLNSDANEKNFHAISLLRTFLTGEESKLFTPSLNRGLSELTLQAIYSDHHGDKLVQLEMSAVGADWFRGEQKARVAKIAKLFKLPQVEPVAASPAAPRPTPAQPVPANARGNASSDEPKSRPTLDRIMAAVETQTKLSKFIITGRGKDNEITSARMIFICVARAFGHTHQSVADALKRSEELIRDLTLPEIAMTAGLRRKVEEIRAKLNK